MFHKYLRSYLILNFVFLCGVGKATNRSIEASVDTIDNENDQFERFGNHRGDVKETSNIKKGVSDEIIKEYLAIRNEYGYSDFDHPSYRFDDQTLSNNFDYRTYVWDIVTLHHKDTTYRLCVYSSQLW